MVDGSILLALPTQSVAVRLVLGAVCALVAARVLLRARWQSPKVRVSIAVLPVVVLVSIATWSLGDPRLPILMVPASDGGQVVLGVGSDYLHLAPLALPALLAAWMAVSTVLMGLRTRRLVQASRRVRALVSAPVPTRIVRAVLATSPSLDLAIPRIIMAPCDGGAAAIGIRRPMLVLDPVFMASLDDDELSGVLAHELAHLARRDNLLAYLSGLARDLTFFVPGGSWALRQLVVERELATDQAAVAVTGKPGALAAGLLKVLDASGVEPGAACAALLPHGTLTARVRTLCQPRVRASLHSTTVESAAVALAFTGLVATALLVPRTLAGNDPEAAFAVLLSPPSVDSVVVGGGVAGVAATATPTWRADAAPRALASYAATATPGSAAAGSLVVATQPITTLSSGLLAACVDAAGCDALQPHRTPTLELHPARAGERREFDVRWVGEPLGRPQANDGMVRIFWLSSIPE